VPRTIPPSFGAAYLRNPPPRYPAEARRNGVEGTVMLRVWVAADGAATRVEIDRSSGHRALDDAALGAVKKWRFVPARRGDEAIEGLVTVPLVFRLDAAG
jgi:protein TonB